MISRIISSSSSSSSSSRCLLRSATRSLLIQSLHPSIDHDNSCRKSNNDYVLLTQTRYLGRKGAKMGQHLRSVEEQAHRSAQHEAKSKKQKGNKTKSPSSSSSSAAAASDMNETNIFDNKNDYDDEIEDEETTNDDDDDDDGLESLPDPSLLRSKMVSVVNRLKESFKAIRGAEPTAELFDSIMVNAYGDKAPLSSVAQVVIVSPTLANVSCFDPSVAKDVRDGIRDALELNPQLEEDGVVKVPLPRVSMETRQKTVKQLGKQAEMARTRIRNLRRKAMDTCKKGQAGKLEGISKDDAFRVSKEIDAIVDDLMKVVTEELESKQASVMSV